MGDEVVSKDRGTAWAGRTLSAIQMTRVANWNAAVSAATARGDHAYREQVEDVIRDYVQQSLRKQGLR